MFKNYFFFDYTTYTEFFVFADLHLLNKNVSTDDFNLIPSFRTDLVRSDLLIGDASNSSMLIPFSENSYWNDKIDLNIYLYLKTSSFISFFINNNVDVPTCFKKSKSLSLKTFELPLIKFFNLIMREGKRDKTIRLFLKKILNRFNLWENFPKYQITDHYRKFFISSSFFLNNYRNRVKEDCFLKSKSFLNLFYSLSFFEKNFLQKNFTFSLFSRPKSFETKFSLFFKNSFLKLFLDANPVFAYFIYSVDKNIKKYSRGKSGKYAFVWKYIAPYKRLFLAMRLFSKELKFRTETKLHDRFLNSVLILENDFKNSFIWQSKSFSHNYVFKNFKKTLLISLKTISK